MPKVHLPTPAALTTQLDHVLHSRRSSRAFVPGEQLPIGNLSTILHAALASRPDGRRPYPSGGALYPIETYVIARSVESLAMGVYHYVASSHVLEHLWDIPHETHLYAGIALSEWAEHMPAIIVFTSVWERSQQTYGDFAYQLCMFEVGHAAQNVLLAATALGTMSCPLAGFNAEEAEMLLDLDPQQESAIYTIALATAPKHS